MKRKTIVLWLVLVAIVFGSVYAYSEYSRTHKDLSGAKPVASLEAGALVMAFEADAAQFNNRYTDKVLAVKGVVKRIDATDNPVVVSLDGGALSTVQCSMDSSHVEMYRGIKEGQTLTVKGVCTGGRAEELFGTDVVLNRCVVTE